MKANDLHEEYMAFYTTWNEKNAGFWHDVAHEITNKICLDDQCREHAMDVFAK